MPGPTRKHTEPPLQPNRDHLHTLSNSDGHVTASSRVGWRMGWCSACGTEAFLYGPSSESLVERRDVINGRGPLSSVDEREELETRCALCDIHLRSERRRHAVLNGYIWYLIVSEGAETVDQATINRSLWSAANGAGASSRELRRAELRRRLAQALEGKGYQEASIILAQDDSSTRVMSYLQQLIPDMYLRKIETDPSLKRAVLGTLGMDYLLREADRGNFQAPWKNRERFFLTDRGLEVLAKGQPLGLPSSTSTPLPAARRVS